MWVFIQFLFRSLCYQRSGIPDRIKGNEQFSGSAINKFPNLSAFLNRICTSDWRADVLNFFFIFELTFDSTCFIVFWNPTYLASYWYSSIFFDGDTFSTFCIPFLADISIGGIFVMEVCKSLAMELSFRVCLASSSTAFVCGRQESQNQRQFDILPSTLMSSEERDTQAPWNHLLHSSHMIQGSTCSDISFSDWPHLDCFALSSETLTFARFGGIERSEVDLLNSRSYLISLSKQLGTTISNNIR